MNNFIENKSKYSFLRFDSEGEPITCSEKKEEALKFLTDTIIPDLIKKNVIKHGETPKVIDIRDNGYDQFRKVLAEEPCKITLNDLHHFLCPPYIQQHSYLSFKTVSLQGSVPDSFSADLNL